MQQTESAGSSAGRLESEDLTGVELLEIPAINGRRVLKEGVLHEV